MNGRLDRGDHCSGCYDRLFGYETRERKRRQPAATLQLKVTVTGSTMTPPPTDKGGVQPLVPGNEVRTPPKSPQSPASSTKSKKKKTKRSRRVQQPRTASEVRVKVGQFSNRCNEAASSEAPQHVFDYPPAMKSLKSASPVSKINVRQNGKSAGTSAGSSLEEGGSQCTCPTSSQKEESKSQDKTCDFSGGTSSGSCDFCNEKDS